MEVSWDFHKHNDMLGFSLLWDNSKPVSHTYRIHTPQGLLSISCIPPGTYAYKTLCPANLNPPRLPWSLPLPNNISVKNDSRDLPVHCTEKQPKFLPYPSISPSFKQLLKKKNKKTHLSHSFILPHPTPAPFSAMLLPPCHYIYCVYDTHPLSSGYNSCKAETGLNVFLSFEAAPWNSG